MIFHIAALVVPAIIDRLPLVISVASNGASPVLSRQIGYSVRTTIPHGMGKLAEFSGQWRKKVKEKIANPDERRIFGKIYMQASPLKEQVFNDNLEVANGLIQQALTEWTAPKGEVLGWGWARGSWTFNLKALRLMQQADVVIYDRLVSAPILELCRRDAEKIYLCR